MADLFPVIVTSKIKARSGIKIAVSSLHALIWLAILSTTLEDAGIGAHFMDCRSNPGLIYRLFPHEDILFDTMDLLLQSGGPQLWKQIFLCGTELEQLEQVVPDFVNPICHIT